MDVKLVEVSITRKKRPMQSSSSHISDDISDVTFSRDHHNINLPLLATTTLIIAQMQAGVRSCEKKRISLCISPQPKNKNENFMSKNKKHKAVESKQTRNCRTAEKTSHLKTGMLVVFARLTINVFFIFRDKVNGQ